MIGSLFKQQPVILFNGVTYLSEQDCACGSLGNTPVVLYTGTPDDKDTDCACAPAPSAPLAAGCTLSGPLAEAEATIVDSCKKAIKRQSKEAQVAAAEPVAD